MGIDAQSQLCTAAAAIAPCVTAPRPPGSKASSSAPWRPPWDCLGGCLGTALEAALGLPWRLPWDWLGGCLGTLHMHFPSPQQDTPMRGAAPQQNKQVHGPQ
eukprot:354140-Chlamydomonas_euryale.AAC.10